jgi:hypothetical protein
MTTLLRKKICREIQRSENRMIQLKTNLEEFSAEGYGSKRVFLPMIIMIIGSFLASSTKGYRNSIRSDNTI